MRNQSHFISYLFIIVSIISCANNQQEQTEALSPPDDQAKETFSIDGLVDEVKRVPDSIMEQLHAQDHTYKVLVRGSMPLTPKASEMKHWKDHAIALDNLPVINPGPGEYVHVMKGYKNGCNNLVIGITETFPGGAPPMHIHEGEESHVLLEGEALYALGDTIIYDESSLHSQYTFNGSACI
ncbi:hypothetical protein [Maribacter arcticus]|uniref:hypothetical protein n=1 Tax=Maribacter arcticus TaxID=561365 RepID=UPI003001D4FA